MQERVHNIIQNELFRLKGPIFQYIWVLNSNLYDHLIDCLELFSAEPNRSRIILYFCWHKKAITNGFGIHQQKILRVHDICRKGNTYLRWTYSVLYPLEIHAMRGTSVEHGCRLIDKIIAKWSTDYNLKSPLNILSKGAP